MTKEMTPDQPESELPQEVVAALKQKYGPPGKIPGALEEQILADAARHLKATKPVPAKSRRLGSRGAWVRWSTGIAAAAVVIALVPLLNFNSNQRQELAGRSAVPSSAMDLTADALEVSAALPNDVDANGEVNILDAFALARQLKNGQQSAAVWDQNQDGRLDVADVELIAQTSVTL